MPAGGFGMVACAARRLRIDRRMNRDGDADQRHRERNIRRRALTISVTLQLAVLAVIILVPLFGKTQRIAAKEWIPIPPYGRPNHHPRGDNKPTTDRQNNTDSRFAFHSPTNRPPLRPGGPMSLDDSPDDNPAGPGPAGPGCDWCVNIGGNEKGPRPPEIETGSHPGPQIIHKTQLDPGMLLRRVEPFYPSLAIQIRREGRVELHAIIGTDGSIQSLQVVAGDPQFVQSALEAVQQWHYKPTYLNGQAVEIDTYITVVYTMKQ
jgi:TonB family protein